MVGSCPRGRGPGRGLRTLLRTLCLPFLGGRLSSRLCRPQAPPRTQASWSGRPRSCVQYLARGGRPISALADLAAIESPLADADRARVVSRPGRASAQAAPGGARRARGCPLLATRCAALTRKRLQTAYEQGEADTLAVVLGARSLDEVLSAIETLDLAATQDKQLLRRARSASVRLASLGRRLAGRERELEQLAAARAAAAASLADARADRLRTIAAVRSASRSNTAEIADWRPCTHARSPSRRRPPAHVADAWCTAGPSGPPPAACNRCPWLRPATHSQDGPQAERRSAGVLWPSIRPSSHSGPGSAFPATASAWPLMSAARSEARESISGSRRWRRRGPGAAAS